MATHDYVIANASGAAVRADLNNALAAIVSNNSNASEPATMYAFQWWADTTAGQLKLRNSANNAWIVIQELDGTMLMEDGTAGAPGLAFASDLDTGFLRPGANQLAASTGGTQRLIVDASGQIGIAEAAPGTLVEIGGTTPYVTLKNSTQEDTSGGRESKVIFEGEQSGGEISTLAQIETSHDGAADDEKGKIVISTNDGSDGATPTAALTISSDQTVAVASNLTVNGNQFPTAGSLSNRSLIINGGMTVAQRGTSVASTADGQYLIDRFKLYDDAANSHTITQSQSSDVPSGSTTSFTKALKLEVTSGAATPADGYTHISQPIEGFVSAQLKYGTADAKTVTLSFWARTNAAGTYSIILRNNAVDRYYISQYTLVSNTWTYITVTVSGDTAGTWLTDNSKGVEVLWALDVGTDFLGTTGAWNAGLKFGVASDTNTWSDTTGNTFELTGVQLEVGSKATEYEHKSYAETLAKCQRYFEGLPVGSTFNQGDAICWSGYTLINGINYATKAFTVEKRAIPTVAMTDNSVITGFNAATCTVGQAGTRGVRGGATATGTVGARYFFLHFTADAEL